MVRDGYDVPIEHGPPRHEVKHAYCDHTKAKTLLKFEDNTKLEELIETMFVWAMKQPTEKSKIWSMKLLKVSTIIGRTNYGNWMA